MRTSGPVSHAVLDANRAPQGSSRMSSVRDVMVTCPMTLPAEALVADARSVLADDHVHMVLLTDGNFLRGTLTRTDLSDVPGNDLALEWAVLAGRVVTPETPAVTALALMVQTELRRLAVVEADHTLVGLLCLKRSRSGFCSDADVASRALTTTDRRTLP